MTEPLYTFARPASRTLLVCTLLLSVLYVPILYLQSPHWARLFEDQQVELPFLARLMLQQGYIWILGILAVVGLLKEVLISNRRVTAVTNGVHLLVVLLVREAYDWAMWAAILKAL